MYTNFISYYNYLMDTKTTIQVYMHYKRYVKQDLNMIDTNFNAVSLFAQISQS
jgi:hypothetical protein